MNEKYSYKKFQDAGLEGIPDLLSDLNDDIKDRINIVSKLRTDDENKAKEFIALCEKIVEELEKLGHSLFCIDYGGDIRYKHNSQLWGTAYQNDHPNGLEIEFRPEKVTVNWIIGPN